MNRVQDSEVMGLSEILQGTSAETVIGVTPEREGLHRTLQLASVFGLVTVALHVAVNLRAQHVGYELFRDEMYYIVCGRHLAWGYVDQPPMVALAARFSEVVFGWHSLALFRILPSLAGGMEVAGTGLLVREMGGSRSAQVLAMIGVMACPVVLAIDAILSMNCFEPLFWIGTGYAVLRAVRGDGTRWGVVAGVVAGLGLENKWNEAFFLFAMLAALLLTPARRRTLGRRWLAVCVVTIVLIALPNLLWEVHRGWPTLIWLHNAGAQDKNVRLGPGTFLWNQVFITGPLSSLLWLGGLAWLLADRAARGLRWMGVLYILYLPGMIALHANDYYLAPVYPLLFAAGGVAWDQWLVGGRVRRIAVPVYVSLVLAYGIVGILIVQPVLTPPEYLRYIAPTSLKPREFNASAHAPQPELTADMTGWRDLADKLAGAYWSLPLSDRLKAGILVANYGEASAVNVYRPDVPAAISGHQNYWYWGPRGHDGSVMVVFGKRREVLEQEFANVTEFARTTNKWGQPYEAMPVYVCRNAKQNLLDAWPTSKKWF
jgi:Dolichyl-phosphate-mannose-protein mannosyltransferase